MAAGVKLTGPALQFWGITGEGDGLSIGGNHLLHVIRRNVDMKVILFNNQIYGLTKGQYSPTSPAGQLSPGTPMGAVAHPGWPVCLPLGGGAGLLGRGRGGGTQKPG